ncbi:MAG: hemerythrin domain-containing protein [Kofleriaceae bacterium]
MGTDILTLLRRDHDDLDKGLVTLLDPAKSLGQIRTALDGVRLGLTAHAEAEDIVFTHAIRYSPARPALEAVVEEAAHAHRLQEIALAALVCTPLDTPEWYRRCEALRELVLDHARYEEGGVLPALRELAPEMYPTLAGKFATERLRQLSMLVPSAPVYIADLARAS